MHKYLVGILECPKCHHSLDWEITEQTDERIVSALIRCDGCSSEYSVSDGMGVFLTGDLERNDLWESADSGLEMFLSEYPELEEKLLGVPLDVLSPVDQHYRGVILEGRGNVEEARNAFDRARNRMYSNDTRRCMNSQLDFIMEQLSRTERPVFDLASGEGTLVNRVLNELPNSVVVTDFSPGVLLKDRNRFTRKGVYERVSLLAMDARRTPFRTGSIETLTTFLGLSNVQDPGNLLEELNRIVSGRFMAVTRFYPEDDLENGEVIRNAGLAEMMYKDRLLKHYKEAGWKVEVEKSCTAWTDASPTGIVLKGAKVDLLPACSTSLEWCVLSATRV